MQKQPPRNKIVVPLHRQNKKSAPSHTDKRPSATPPQNPHPTPTRPQTRKTESVLDWTKQCFSTSAEWTKRIRMDNIRMDKTTDNLLTAGKGRLRQAADANTHTNHKQHKQQKLKHPSEPNANCTNIKRTTVSNKLTNFKHQANLTNHCILSTTCNKQTILSSKKLI